MTALQIIAKKGTDAVKQLRLQTLRDGLPFMINSHELESNQSYLEYPDGAINLVFLEKGERDFTIIRALSSKEAQTVRAKYGLAYPAHA